jgi:catechol 2,3-dioxygenase-like lactoylglutathione lyase family enzyme
MLADAPIAPSLPASDIDRARRFYEEKLGFEPVQDDDGTGNVMYGSSDGTRFTVYPSAFAGTNQATAAAWQVDDLGRVVAELRNRGVAFEEYDLPGLETVDGIATAPDGGRGAWFKDTEGNILGLVQMPS